MHHDIHAVHDMQYMIYMQHYLHVVVRKVVMRLNLAKIPPYKGAADGKRPLAHVKASVVIW